MRILTLTPYWLATKGGYSTNVARLIQEFSNQGCHVEVFSTDPRRVAESSTSYFDRLPLGIGRLIYRVVLSAPDVIHVHEHGHLLFAAVMAKFIRPRTQIFVTFHTMPQEQSKLGVLHLAMWRLMMSCCAAMVTLTQSHRREMIKALPLSNVRLLVIPFGVEVGNTAVVAIRTSRNCVGQFVVTTVGVFQWESKVVGIERLLDAFRKFAHNKDARCVIIGDGLFRRRIDERIAQLGIGALVSITGELERQSVVTHLCETDVFVHLGQKEALSAAILEAMACGVPIVTDRCYGEVLRHGEEGWLVDSSSPDEIVEALEALYADKLLRRRLGEAATRRTQEDFSWKRCGENYLALFSAR